ncbi:hypothetical protein [Azoarcus olearius]|uniref:Uncharacterized protein n=1 Tax=Azoarcus sp. (strain BH72) TaxID=418699 RepID=A1K3S5_AZOSB|nr:hypothetical protein [Azoarcus olearius]ANQ84002.1 hypothetical protein dqs_0934 [Azoarcus olearius]CAL93480.1 hypothetical protein predicted by Glimmer/Critica [Azoarcus olearius]
MSGNTLIASRGAPLPAGDAAAHPHRPATARGTGNFAAETTHV